MERLWNTLPVLIQNSLSSWEPFTIIWKDLRLLRSDPTKACTSFLDTLGCYQNINSGCIWRLSSRSFRIRCLRFIWELLLLCPSGGQSCHESRSSGTIFTRQRLILWRCYHSKLALSCYFSNTSHLMAFSHCYRSTVIKVFPQENCLQGLAASILTATIYRFRKCVYIYTYIHTSLPVFYEWL